MPRAASRPPAPPPRGQPKKEADEKWESGYGTRNGRTAGQLPRLGFTQGWVSWHGLNKSSTDLIYPN